MQLVIRYDLPTVNYNIPKVYTILDAKKVVRLQSYKFTWEDKEYVFDDCILVESFNNKKFLLLGPADRLDSIMERAGFYGVIDTCYKGSLLAKIFYCVDSSKCSSFIKQHNYWVLQDQFESLEGYTFGVDPDWL